jgi:trigger factor
MEGLIEGLIGAKVGDTRTINVSFPERLRDKTLAGKKAIFDVTVNTASSRKLPEVNDEFAAQVREGLTAASLEKELKKAIDEQDQKDFLPARNDALGKALAARVDMEVPDTLITNQAKEKYAMMMAEFREQGMADAEIKKLISPENFLKYKKIYAEGIVEDFKASMAVDEIAKLENIDVPENDVMEQLKSLKLEAEKEGEEFDEAVVRSKVEATLQKRLVFDFLAEHADLEVEYKEEDKFDAESMEQILEESVEREKKWAEEAAATAET